MTCARCHSEISAASRFCPKCGAAIAVETPTRKTPWPLWLGMGILLLLIAGEGVFASRHRGGPEPAAPSEASLILKNLVEEEKAVEDTSVPPAAPAAPPQLPAAAATPANCPAAPAAPKCDDSGRLRAEAELLDERARHAADLSAAAAREQQLQAQLSVARKTPPGTGDDAAKLRDENRQLAARLDDARQTIAANQQEIDRLKKLAVFQTPDTSGEIVWQGEVRGTQLVKIEDGVADVGAATGKLPGVACFIQSSDPKRVVITDPPRPSNGFRRLVFQVQGNGKVTLRFSWVVQK